ncbi:MAG: hypothetical protein OXU20_20200 [Myxococcales bacterium]|nr:hypothetical protein [Myxococcales bacterium]
MVKTATTGRETVLTRSNEVDGDGDDDREVIAEFVTGAITLLEEADTQLASPGGVPSDMAALTAAYRAFRTIRGLARFLRFEGLEVLAQASEDLLFEACCGRTALRTASTDMVRQSVSVLRRHVLDIGSALTDGKPVPRPVRLAPGLVRDMQQAVHSNHSTYVEDDDAAAAMDRHVA